MKMYISKWHQVVTSQISHEKSPYRATCRETQICESLIYFISVFVENLNVPSFLGKYYTGSKPLLSFLPIIFHFLCCDKITAFAWGIPFPPQHTLLVGLSVKMLCMPSGDLSQARLILHSRNLSLERNISPKGVYHSQLFFKSWPLCLDFVLLVNCFMSLSCSTCSFDFIYIIFLKLKKKFWTD